MLVMFSHHPFVFFATATGFVFTPLFYTVVFFTYYHFLLERSRLHWGFNPCIQLGYNYSQFALSWIIQTIVKE